MSSSKFPSWVETIVEKYRSSSEYERRYTPDFERLDPEKQLLIVLIDLYPEENEPATLNEHMSAEIGAMYPKLRNLEQENIVSRTSGGEYKLQWRQETEQRLKDTLA